MFNLFLSIFFTFSTDHIHHLFCTLKFWKWAPLTTYSIILRVEIIPIAFLEDILKVYSINCSSVDFSHFYWSKEVSNALELLISPLSFEHDVISNTVGRVFSRSNSSLKSSSLLGVFEQTRQQMFRWRTIILLPVLLIVIDWPVNARADKNFSHYLHWWPRTKILPMMTSLRQVWLEWKAVEVVDLWRFWTLT